MIAPSVAGSKSLWTSRHGSDAHLLQVRLAEAGFRIDALRSRHAEPMPSVATHQLVEALTGRLDVIDCIVDELGVDWSREVGELPLVLDPQIIGQGLQAMGLAGEGRGERFHVEKVAALKLNSLAPTTLTARCLLMRWLGKPEKG